MKIFSPTEERPVLKLRNNDIHLWVSLPQSICRSDLLENYKNLLSEEELQKQQSYMFSERRHNALITQAFVRDLLSHYVDVPPASWQFRKGSHGKPEIENIHVPLSLRFNLSHTDDLIICVVSLNNDIGCDVEMTNRRGDFLSVAKNNFSSSEFLDLLHKPKNQQSSRFLDYWTLKESYIKACGHGLAIPLADFSFHIGSARFSQYNDNINISFSSNIFDHEKFWCSWLFCSNEKYRIAISARSQSQHQSWRYRFRYFENIPLILTRELNGLNFGI